MHATASCAAAPEDPDRLGPKQLLVHGGQLLPAGGTGSTGGGGGSMLGSYRKALFELLSTWCEDGGYASPVQYQAAVRNGMELVVARIKVGADPQHDDALYDLYLWGVCWQ